ncbi:rRNA processing protein [Coemansia sp. RSA 988]|nr:rRNA processing protein [Coemansia sp. RSA 988]
MPRTSKKKQRKAEDFKKVKLKVGQRKAAVGNATDTAFAARTVVVAAQSTTVDRSAQAVGVTQRELLGRLRHRGAAVRREAAAGLADSVARHGAAELGPTVEGGARLVGDSDADVRRSALQLLATVLARTAARDLAPFVAVVAAFACAAMTHVVGDVRSDAVRLVDQLVDAAPRAVVPHVPRILPALVALVAATPGARLAGLRSCERVLRLCSVERPLKLDQPRVDSLFFHPDAAAPFAALGLFGEAAAPAGAAGSARALSGDALRRLLPQLQATWMEAAAIFGSGRISASASLDLCSVAMQVLQTLWCSAEAVLPAALEGFLRQCMVHFPFGRECAVDPAAADIVMILNIRASELAAVVCGGPNEPCFGEPSSGPVFVPSDLPSGPLSEPVRLSSVERARILRRAVRFARQALEPAARSHAHVAELLPVAWRLAHAAPGDATALVDALMHYGAACAATAPAKATSIRLVARAVLAPEWAAHGLAARDQAVAWLLSLPQLLWRLRDRNLAASAAVVVALRTAVLRTRLLDSAAAAALQARLVPLFCADVPVHGTVFGPFCQFPPALQRAMLNFVHCYPQSSPALARAVELACAQSPNPGLSERGRSALTTTADSLQVF